jgi:polyisoprenoid-binding protein YceI
VTSLPGSSRVLMIAGAVVLLGLIAAGGGGYLYFFSGARTAPKALSLSPAPTSSPASSQAAATGLAGTWTVTQGSQAGYRVREQFAGQTLPHEAVSRTSSVTGSVTVSAANGALQASGLNFVVQLKDLASVDQVAGFNVTQRDQLVQRSLGVSQFPTAMFQADAVTLPNDPSAALVKVSVPGRLTLHGVTKAVVAAVDVQASGDRVNVAGVIPITYTDFGVSPPRAPFVTPETQATIEFTLVLARNGGGAPSERSPGARRLDQAAAATSKPSRSAPASDA